MARLAPPLKIAVSIGLLALLVRQVDYPHIRALLEGLSPLLAGTAVLLFLLQGLVLAVRWALVAASLETPPAFPAALPALFVGLFFNQVLPTSFGGDALRMWRAYRLGADPEKAVAGVVLERLGGILGLIALSAFGALLLWDRLAEPWLGWALLLPLPLALLGLIVIGLFPRLPAAWWRRGPLQALPRYADYARRVLLVPDRALPLFLLSLLAHVLAVGAFYAGARALGIAMPLQDAFSLVPAIILATLLPLSFAAWGLREGAAVALLGLAGYPADQALTASILFGLTLLAASLPGLPLWLSWGPKGLQNTVVPQAEPPTETMGKVSEGSAG